MDIDGKNQSSRNLTGSHCRAGEWSHAIPYPRGVFIMRCCYDSVPTREGGGWKETLEQDPFLYVATMDQNLTPGCPREDDRSPTVTFRPVRTSPLVVG